ncbi:hypothetical protein ACIQAL_10020 [Pseudomonas sp. NPDC088368]|uniref:hypothetical protein n=1 Tax=Pseudomonas sp. NPDC088368 TaxID=3364453 RepID=UPI00382A4E53
MDENMQDRLKLLREELNANAPQGKAYDIIGYVVDATLRQKAENATEVVRFNRDNFATACHPSRDARQVDVGKWVPKTQDLQAALQRLQRGHAGKSQIVLCEEIGGGRGRTNQYWLALEEKPAIPDQATLATPTHDLIYHRSTKGEVKTALILRRLFRDGELRNRSPKGLLFLGTVMLASTIWVVMFAISLLGMWMSNQPLSIGHLTQLIVSSSMFWLVWQIVYQPWWRLLDDRVVSAPLWVAALAEDPCQLEMYRHGGEKWIRLVRFSANCPLCGGGVTLTHGKPDQSVPLVGRCLESPHYHVFSFDRSHLLGTYIGPPLPEALKLSTLESA